MLALIPGFIVFYYFSCVLLIWTAGKAERQHQAKIINPPHYTKDRLGARVTSRLQSNLLVYCYLIPFAVSFCIFRKLFS